MRVPVVIILPFNIGVICQSISIFNFDSISCVKAVYLAEQTITFGTGSHSAETARDIPEAHVRTLWLRYDHLETVRLLHQPREQVLRERHVTLHLLRETFRALRKTLQFKLTFII